MPQVPLTRTVIDPTTYARAVLAAARQLGWPPISKQGVGVLHAQFMIETGGRACWNWNIGNVKVSAGQVAAGVPWIDLPGTWEIIKGERVVLKEGDPGRRFRAFGSLAEAMIDHLRLLRERKYKMAWPHVEAGDPVGFAHALKAGPDGKQGTHDDYYTAPAANYASGMLRHYRAFLSSGAYERVTPDEAPTQPDLAELHNVPSSIPPPMATVTVLPDTLQRCPRCGLQSCAGYCPDVA